MADKEPKGKRPVYWISPLGETDPWGYPFGDTMYDGRMRSGGQWANFSQLSWEFYGCGLLGVGMGQKYKKQADGRWLQVEGGSGS